LAKILNKNIIKKRAIQYLGVQDRDAFQEGRMSLMRRERQLGSPAATNTMFEPQTNNIYGHILAHDIRVGSLISINTNKRCDG
jgi:hypothetical protein